MFQYKLLITNKTMVVDGEVYKFLTADKVINWSDINRLFHNLFGDYNFDINEYCTYKYNRLFYPQAGRIAKKLIKDKYVIYELLVKSPVLIRKDMQNYENCFERIISEINQEGDKRYLYESFIRRTDTILPQTSEYMNLKFSSKSPIVLRNTKCQLMNPSSDFYKQLISKPYIQEILEKIGLEKYSKNHSFYFIPGDSLVRKYSSKTFSKEIGSEVDYDQVVINSAIEEIVISENVIPVNDQDYIALLLHSIDYQPKQGCKYEFYVDSRRSYIRNNFMINNKKYSAVGCKPILFTNDDEFYKKALVCGLGNLRKYGFGYSQNYELMI